MIGKNIKRIRESLNMGLNETARKIGMSSGYLSALERGEKKNPSTKTLEKIADALGVTLDYLTRKSAKAIIEDKLEELNMSVETLSKRAKVPVQFINSLDDVIPFEGDYERLKPIADVLNVDSKVLVNALYRQEPPAYDGPVISAEEAFGEIKDNQLNSDQIQILNDFDKLNDIGKSKAKERIHELTLIPTYLNAAKEEYTFAAHDDGLDPKKSEERKKLAKKIFKKMDEQ